MTLGVTNVGFYFCMMAVFVLEGWVLSTALPFHRRANEKERESGRLAPLDGLRGILAPSVLATHAASYYYFARTGVWSYPPSNFYGQMGVFPVSMFFFITGYLFWSKLARRSSFAAGKFWLGRLGRLMPAYAAACVCLFLMAAYVSGFHRQVPIAALALQIAGWLSFRGRLDVNGVKNSQLWLGVVWTLQYEWLFYFSLPFLGWFAGRKRRTSLLLAISMAAASVVAHATRGGMLGSAVGLLANYLRYFAFTFSVGILSAMLPRERLARMAQGKLAAVLSLAAIGLTLAWIPPELGLRESLGLAFPFMCVSLGNTWFGLLSTRSLRFLGRISYSFYLFHVLALTFVMMALKKHNILQTLAPLPYWATVAGCGVATIFLCAFSYEWLEEPFLHVGRRAGKKAVPAVESTEMLPAAAR